MKIKKKYIILILIVLQIVTLSYYKSNEIKNYKEVKKIRMVAGLGGINDNSFNS